MVFKYLLLRNITIISSQYTLTEIALNTITINPAKNPAAPIPENIILIPTTKTANSDSQYIIVITLGVMKESNDNNEFMV